MKNILEIQDLSVGYPGQEAVVRNINFSVEKGEITAVVGESGSGKSTLLSAILGLIPSGGKISGGRILYDGEDMSRLNREERRLIRGGKIAMVFQNAGEYLNPRRKIGSQYLEMMKYHLPGTKKEHRSCAMEMMKKLHLADPERVMQSYPFELSGGMRQRVALAMAMSSEPELLLADEPTSALDVTVQAQVVREMLQMRAQSGTTILIVTHNIGVASRMADHIVVMKDGEQREYGTRQQVIENPQDEYTKYLLSAVPELERDEDDGCGKK